MSADDDEYPGDAAHQMQLLEQEWLADEAAQAEYESWLALLNSQSLKAKSWDDTHPIPEISPKPRPEHM